MLAEIAMLFLAGTLLNTIARIVTFM
jgi:hypothetical protein